MSEFAHWPEHGEVMAVRTGPLPQNRKAWLQEIARRLAADYEALLEPVPPRFARLIEQMELGERSGHEGDET
jgi:hypothetical protein